MRGWNIWPVTLFDELTLRSGRFYLTFSEYESDTWVMDLEWE